ncbi:two-component system response regulator NarL [Moritella viscosa]|uniref:DNA-binding nitrate/nitrite response regulator n=1 Tax=Moritella viscosa TaxID=80854 RepID=A0A1L0AEU3_9GAMM|nr:two-component system response regulator NarL [Moritella viscosa]SGZ14708.1 DNA-binding nitrate/nitrite response regulator [Moritella viscosa]SHO14132.1 DNA-binding nitrate/nitrite response regulator [Moritella viscosa]SHO14135.1 DNA-binding nitrate/nitrite response regulator [Moritella viscosa]SHO17247.1 DNA-binding nitrate/nitrite response regulator [Moritella viscosa]SHO18771.1 DNA-binding nitrate/nitrite response regulator [Moritella viscosa]
MLDNSYTILVVDDHPLMRKGIVQLLTLEEKFNVIGEASDGVEAITLAKQHEPDLVLLDLNMKGMSGLDTLKALRSEELSSRVVILTVSDNKQDVIKLINAGADGYLLKDSEPDLLLEQLQDVLSGQQALSESLLGYLDCLHEDNNFEEKLAKLTKRENQILLEISKGYSNKHIASNLHISEGTVKVHVKSLLKKLEASSRVEAAVMYLEFNKTSA